jgi:hypothetical protein
MFDRSEASHCLAWHLSPTGESGKLLRVGKVFGSQHAAELPGLCHDCAVTVPGTKTVRAVTTESIDALGFA